MESLDGTIWDVLIAGTGIQQSLLSFVSLSPQLIYARSPLLPVLVSSRIDRQLEFQAVGSWWVYSQQGHLVRVPSAREDVFADTTLDVRAKRSLMKFLRFVANYEDQSEMWEPYRSKPFSAFLTQQFRLPPALHDPLLALTLSPCSPQETSTEPSLAKVARHLRSIGVFGPGFGAVIPKWGGLAEIAQVACRAGAVGGAVCVLNRGVDGIEDNSTLKSLPDDESKPLSVRLRDKNAAGVVYASTATTGLEGSETLDKAVARLLQNVGENPTPQVLWSMRYEQSSSVSRPLPQMSSAGTGNLGQSGSADHVLIFPPSSLDLVFDDSILQRVRSVWEKIMGAEAEGFMTFEDREGMGMETEGEDQD
ncbi:hypothetical protein B0A49_07845 [Cryomyces minteri]|uniref:Rab proteins geranylgeranyltransferase n=1 Tax=Cryomyces minteri TaxID=331657 RepID=A0A4U0WLP7_9PEZI|nr:hypothetical protein B0A49_07845 [Cryomyces minteri]